MAPPVAAPPAAPPAGYEPTSQIPAPAPGSWDSTTESTAIHAPVPGGPAIPEAPPSDSAVGAIVALIGAAGLIIGSFLSWAEPTQDASSDVGDQLARLGLSGLSVPTLNGFDSNGIGTLLCGVVVALGAGLLLAGVRHIALKLAIIVAGLAGIGLFAFSYLDLTDLPVTVNGQTIEGISFDPGIGLWVVAAGGVVAVVGGVLSKSD